MLVAGRPAAGHRLVGPGRQLAAGPPGQRLDGDACEHPSRPPASGRVPTTGTGDARRRPTRDRRPAPGELTARELLRWAWRQLTSMRTALVLLLLLALAAIPGLGDPAERRRLARRPRSWQDAAPAADADLRAARPVLGLRLAVVLRDLHPADGLAGRLHRAAPVRLLARRCAPSRRPRPRNLTRLPGPRVVHAPTTTPDDVLGPRRATLLRKRRYRVRRSPTDARVAPSAATCARPATCSSTSSVLVVLVGFAIGSLFGYKGGVILVVGNGFSNTLTQYDDFVPGASSTPTTWSRSPSPSTTSTSTG